MPSIRMRAWRSKCSGVSYLPSNIFRSFSAFSPHTTSGSSFFLHSLLFITCLQTYQQSTSKHCFFVPFSPSSHHNFLFSLRFSIYLQVSWVRRKGDELNLITFGRHTYSSDSRYSLEYIAPNDWQLLIQYANERDEGHYECQISSHPPLVLLVYLTVVGKHTRTYGTGSWKIIINKKKNSHSNDLNFVGGIGVQHNTSKRE